MGENLGLDGDTAMVVEKIEWYRIVVAQHAEDFYESDSVDKLGFIRVIWNLMHAELDWVHRINARHSFDGLQSSQLDVSSCTQGSEAMQTWKKTCENSRKAVRYLATFCDAGVLQAEVLRMELLPLLMEYAGADGRINPRIRYRRLE